MLISISTKKYKLLYLRPLHIVEYTFVKMERVRGKKADRKCVRVRTESLGDLQIVSHSNQGFVLFRASVCERAFLQCVETREFRE